MNRVAPISRRILAPVTRGFADQRLLPWFTAGMGTLAFFFPFSLLFVAGGLLPDRFAWTASVIIILNGAVTVLSELRSGSAARVLRDFGLLVLLLTGVEWIGVRTGFPFGAYAYTDALPPAIDGIPLAIPFAWYASVANARRLGEAVLGGHAARRPWHIAILAGLITLGIDIVLEPMASWINGYWLWQDSTVPLQNYASWFLLGTAAARWLVRSRPVFTEPDSAVVGRQSTAAILLGMQWALFAATNIAHGYVLATAVSGCLLALLWTGYRRTAPAESRSSEGIP